MRSRLFPTPPHGFLSLHTWSWIGGLLSGMVALFVLVDQLTFESELRAAEIRLVQASDDSDRRILEQLLSMQQLLIAQQKQQFLTLRKDLLVEQIDRLYGDYEKTPKPEYEGLYNKIMKLEESLFEVERQLEKLLLEGLLQPTPR